MQISNRAKLIFSGVLVLIAIILILFWPRSGQKPATTPTANQGNEQVGSNSQPSEPVAPPEPLSVEEKQARSAETVAKIFVERFGSYSSESEAQNLEDVLPLTTLPYRATLEAQIAKLQAAEPADEYYGVSTRFISSTTVAMNGDAATFDVVTQREEAVGSVSNTSVKYQTLRLELELVGEDWLVDSAIWE